MIVAMKTVLDDTKELLTELGVAPEAYSGGGFANRTPITGEVIADMRWDDDAAADAAIAKASGRFRNVALDARS